MENKKNDNELHWVREIRDIFTYSGHGEMAAHSDRSSVSGLRRIYSHIITETGQGKASGNQSRGDSGLFRREILTSNRGNIWVLNFKRF